MPTITSFDVHDLRFPTSLSLDGSDAMNKDGDYSAAYVVLHTDDRDLSGFGFTFTIGRGNDLCVVASAQRAEVLVGREVGALAADLGLIYREIQSDSQMRWLGPDKGVVHLATAAVMNAVWDLAARAAKKPLWQFLSDMSPEQLVDAADMGYLENAMTREDALKILRRGQHGRAERLEHLQQSGYPCYTTSAGWLGYSDEKMLALIREALEDGYQHIKLKVGANLEDDIRRCRLAREEIGWDRHLMVDANQIWEVPQAIEWMRHLQEFKPLWIEEPTSPDDVLGHQEIRAAVSPVKVATGEHGMNRVLFKQMLQAKALDFCQLDAARLAGVNEVIAVYLLAAHFDVPVCPHAGGVGLCELVQHLSVFDYLAVSTSMENRVTEYVDHLHEHFVDPVRVKNAAYLLPNQPGYSAEIFGKSIEEFSYPAGSYWMANPRNAM